MSKAPYQRRQHSSENSKVALLATLRQICRRGDLRPLTSISRSTTCRQVRHQQWMGHMRQKIHDDYPRRLDRRPSRRNTNGVRWKTTSAPYHKARERQISFLLTSMPSLGNVQDYWASPISPLSFALGYTLHTIDGGSFTGISLRVGHEAGATH